MPAPETMTMSSPKIKEIPASEEMIMVSPEIIEKGLGRELAHSTEKSVRDAGIEKFYRLLKNNGSNWKELNFLKCWKGLYYCFWMSDKPLVQQELANNLASIIHDLEDNVAIQYLDAFWTTLASEWHNLDRIRLNKYYFLIRRIHIHTFTWLSHRKWDCEKIHQVLSLLQKGPLNFDSMKIPNSLRYHTIEVFFTHLADACALPDAHPITKDAMKLILAPLLYWLKSSDNINIVNHIFSDILDGYKSSEVDQETPAFLPSILSTQEMALLLYSIPSDSTTRPKNKKMIENYLLEWSSSVGIPFTPSMTITGLHVRKIELKFDPESLSAHSTPLAQKRKPSITHQILNGPDSNHDTKDKKRKKSSEENMDLEKVQVVVERKQEDSIEKNGAAMVDKKREAVVEKIEEAVIERKEENESEKKKKRKSKKKKTKLSESEKQHALLQQELEKTQKKSDYLDLESNQEVQDKEFTQEEETLLQDPVIEEGNLKKSVTWGPKRIKPFKKYSLICSNEEAQTVPVITEPAPKVLKKFKKQAILLHTAGSRKSKRL